MIDQRELFDAIVEGAKASKYGRDGSNGPGNLTTFFKNIANQHPAAFCSLLETLIELEDGPQTIGDDNVVSPKPGRWQ
jgi:hypothetical protein